MEMKEATDSAKTTGTKAREATKAFATAKAQQIVLGIGILIAAVIIWSNIGDWFGAIGTPGTYEGLIALLLIGGIAVAALQNGAVGGAMIVAALTMLLWGGFFTDSSGTIKTYQEGSKLELSSGQAKTIILAGKVRVPIETCHRVNAKPTVQMEWNSAVTYVLLSPLDGLDEQETTVTMLKSKHEACKNYWK